MTKPRSKPRWQALDGDLNRITSVEHANTHVARPLLAPGIALVFVALAGLTAAVLFGHADGGLIVVAGAIFGAYMAINIGANDVSNNMGPAVGANALTMAGAITIAALAESAGALLAGGDVVSTISRKIIDPSSVADATTFIWAMMASLISAAMWVNLSTWIGAPVSTTHSIVGGVMGAAIAAAGLHAVNWETMGVIAASWVIAPILGGVIAACFLALIRAKIQSRDDKIAAARRWVPVLVALMAGAFATYMAVKGLSHVLEVRPDTALVIGAGVGLVVWAATVPWVRWKSAGMENRTRSVKSLFRMPLAVAATFLSFAHGANDVANAVGPLAGIVHATQHHDMATEVAIPQWVMIIGAFGISFGLFLFGPKLIRMVGKKITRLNPIRGFCIALSAATTVIVASWLGLPVSSTHVAVGAVFGVGFFREWDQERRWKRTSRDRPQELGFAPEEHRRRKLVRRSHFLTIVAAWVVTVPAAAALSAAIFFVLTAFS